MFKTISKIFSTGFLSLFVLASLAFAVGPRPRALMYQTTSTVPTTHSVTLTWTASSDASASNPVTYDVLRATGACTSTTLSFATLVTGVAVTTYTDTTVVGGQTYCYETEAVGQNQAVSGPSNTAVGAVPPFPPTGETVTQSH